jgi:hypothetical protein
MQALLDRLARLPFAARELPEALEAVAGPSAADENPLVAADDSDGDIEVAERV